MKTATSALFSHHISAGFPSPADDHSDGTLNLQNHLVRTPSTTFFMRVSGDSMINAGIHEGDLLVVDRALTPIHNDIVIAVVDSEFTVKRLLLEKNSCSLKPENPAYPTITFSDCDNLTIWGVVMHSIHSFRC